MLLAAMIILIGADQMSAIRQLYTPNLQSQIKTLNVNTGTHCIDYKDFIYSASAEAISYESSSRRFGSVDCSSGDIALMGTYIQLGKIMLCYEMLSAPCSNLTEYYSHFSPPLNLALRH
jgi:hypothetical protein